MATLRRDGVWIRITAPKWFFWQSALLTQMMLPLLNSQTRQQSFCSCEIFFQYFQVFLTEEHTCPAYWSPHRVAKTSPLAFSVDCPLFIEDHQCICKYPQLTLAQSLWRTKIKPQVLNCSCKPLIWLATAKSHSKSSKNDYSKKA